MPEESMTASDNQRSVFRFAPSPNGRLHLGHALSALLNREMAVAAGGRLLLRIEDIDLSRCTPHFEAAIIDDLSWLGVSWEEPVRRQSEHLDDYREALQRLIDRGLAYPAFMTRGEVKAYVAEAEQQGRSWPRDPDGALIYPPVDRQRPQAERDRLISEGRRHAWRLDTTKAASEFAGELTWMETGDGPRGTIDAHPAAWGDIVLWRSDGPSSYHLSVTVDDALQDVTHVVRGLDLFHATAIHRLLQELLGLPAPAYHHHRLILGADGRKLSKSAGDTALAALREQGITSADVRRLVGLA